MSRHPHRRIRTMVVTASLLAAPALVLGLAPSPAGAAFSGVTVSDTTPADNQTITVSGFVSPGAVVSIAQCNTDATTPGTACNATTPTRFARVTANATTGAFSANIVVDDSFTNASFVPGVPAWGTTTDCDASAGSDPCAIELVEYVSNVPVDFETVPVTF